MPNNTSENDPKTLWQQEVQQMALNFDSQHLRRRADDLQSKRRQKLLHSIVFAVLLVACSLYGFVWAESAMARVLFAVTAVWVSVGQYLLRRMQRLAPSPEEVGLRTSLDSCRRELERRIRFDRGALLWLHGPLFSLVSALGVLIGNTTGEGVLVKMASPFFALLMVWALGLVAFRYMQERQFRRAIVDLDQIGREQEGAGQEQVWFEKRTNNDIT